MKWRTCWSYPSPLTEREEFIARAFDHGAADYVVKPFSPAELAARIRAALRRREVSEPLESYVHGDLAVAFARRRSTLGGRRVPLLAELAADAGRVLTHKHLGRRVWGRKGGDDVWSTRTVVGRLRRELGDDADDRESRPRRAVTFVLKEPDRLVTAHPASRNSGPAWRRQRPQDWPKPSTPRVARGLQ